MKFECGDLERALENPELMPEAREHLRDCPACRREYQLWNEISGAARGLHVEWDSSELWPNIRSAIEANAQPRPRWWTERKLWFAAAATLVVVLAGIHWGSEFIYRTRSERLQPSAAANQMFLTEQALSEVQRTEEAYRRSIDTLSRLAEPKLAKQTPEVAVNYREKLLMLDSAILETRSNVAHNQFNTRLQTELADLYHQKQATLRELLNRDQHN
jgi:hypothetical protein